MNMSVQEILELFRQRPDIKELCIVCTHLSEDAKKEVIQFVKELKINKKEKRPASAPTPTGQAANQPRKGLN